MNTMVLAALRGAGKSHDLISWLCAGQPTGHWLGWSRMVVVANPATATHLRRVHADRLAALEGPKIRRDQLVLPLSAYLQLRGLGELEIALDDAQTIIERALRRTPAVIALHGERIHPGDLSGSRHPELTGDDIEAIRARIDASRTGAG